VKKIIITRTGSGTESRVVEHQVVRFGRKADACPYCGGAMPRKQDRPVHWRYCSDLCHDRHVREISAAAKNR
jgi:hypothetical protein